MSRYLKDIAQLDDFDNLNHKKWERSVIITLYRFPYLFELHALAFDLITYETVANYAVITLILYSYRPKKDQGTDMTTDQAGGDTLDS